MVSLSLSDHDYSTISGKLKLVRGTKDILEKEYFGIVVVMRRFDCVYVDCVKVAICVVLMEHKESLWNWTVNLDLDSRGYKGSFLSHTFSPRADTSP